MKKNHKLCTLLEFRGSDLSVKTVKAVENKIKGIDNDICKSHIKERKCNEARAVIRVKEDPKYFFRYAKKFKRTSENIGPLLNGDGQLTNDMQEISHILSNQFCSTFSTPRLEEVTCDPITFLTLIKILVLLNYQMLILANLKYCSLSMRCHHMLRLALMVCHRNY